MTKLNKINKFLSFLVFLLLIISSFNESNSFIRLLTALTPFTFDYLYSFFSNTSFKTNNFKEIVRLIIFILLIVIIILGIYTFIVLSLIISNFIFLIFKLLKNNNLEIRNSYNKTTNHQILDFSLMINLIVIVVDLLNYTFYKIITFIFHFIIRRESNPPFLNLYLFLCIILFTISTCYINASLFLLFYLNIRAKKKNIKEEIEEIMNRNIKI